MNNTRTRQERPIPALLVLMLLAACILSVVAQYAATFLISRFGPPSVAYYSLVYQWTSFPFSLSCTVWLAARNGRTAWSTWGVPVLLLLILTSFPVIGLAIRFISMSSSMSNIASILFMQWSNSFKLHLLEYVFLAFAFRATTLHLRPVNAKASSHRLTVFSILVFTMIVAFSLSIDGLLSLDQTRAMSFGESKYIAILRTLLYSVFTALVWYSTAWLFVTENPKRWLAGLGLVLYVVSMGAFSLMIMPWLMNQQTYPRGVTVPTYGPFYFLGLFAVQVFHISFVFLCIGMMHLAGYRWDIRRRPASIVEAPKTHSDGIPPLLVQTAP